jgi:TolA-binding protein
VVETPDAEVLVRGTVFDVWVEPRLGSTNTHVHVTRGSVWVLTQGVQVALLSAGQTWSSAGGVEPAEARVAPVLPTVATPVADLTTPSPAGPTPEHATAPSVGHAAAVVTSAKDAAAHKSGTLAEENRLFAAGVEARNRGDSQRAAELFGELLSSYPQSTLREVAQVERFRALNGSGQKGRAATEARKYLAEHPDGAARSEARDMALEPQR